MEFFSSLGAPDVFLGDRAAAFRLNTLEEIFESSGPARPQTNGLTQKSIRLFLGSGAGLFESVDRAFAKVTPLDVEGDPLSTRKVSS